MDTAARNEQLLDRRSRLTEGLVSLPYDLILYLERAVVHSDLGYPDLAAGDAYRALLLADEVLNEGFEYHDQALESLQMHTAVPLPDVLVHGNLPEDELHDSQGDSEGDDVVRRLATLASVRAYQILSLGLLLCGSLKSAASFCQRGLKLCPSNRELLDTKNNINMVARRRLRRDDVDIDYPNLPDGGLVRREVYPWNDHEPDRFSAESLTDLNEHLSQMAPKCAVEVATLPILLEGASSTDDYEIIPTCKQLGVFAKEDIAPGEVVLREYSLLTANNRLKDSICDACSSDLPPLGSENEPVSCDECYDTVFCTQYCHDQAMERYHPAVCEKDVDAIAKDPDAFEADETLYLLLLSRVLAIAAHEEVHPLDVREVKYIWGDFVPTRTNDINVSPNAGPPPEWTLPFSFKYSIETPLHVLEKMDIDIYASLAEYDLWVLNTLYAKFRGTASARKNPRDGRPDVAAVHPYWCLANHDCDPNVTWEWGGRMVLEARRERVLDGRPGGIKRGEEILNHYCDVNLPVQQRREWARGSLGGWCMCKRCRDEAAASDSKHEA
ncbi:MYND-type zinc finger protein samB [Fusarium keratoplasticum]|uniref:MYND-type zinc finger protein samB n=1 Tax=Fusarium keratoplasticum TaxID=1328300 RepID=A0ACC0R1X2_9HYPO|nr:MYND-type zinc finger protein samB [Fusarium keratoplasticum]KAI8671384.1 MYND-type zinc finger protein samB [Fusarium keratoplasticum]KAI8678613.1 MYND-type zinc finger protein samB [Fusarium keratoplasticum]